MTTKYPNRNKQNASLINQYANEDFDYVLPLLDRTNSVTKSCTGYFLNLQDADRQRSGNARKYIGHRFIDGKLETLTLSLQCTQGGTTGLLDAVTLFVTAERDGIVYQLPTVNGDGVTITESNGVTKFVRGFIGLLQDLTPQAIADFMMVALGKALTAPLGEPVRDNNAHKFNRKQWQHPIFPVNAWKNGGRHIGSVGKVTLSVPKRVGRK